MRIGMTQDGEDKYGVGGELSDRNAGVLSPGRQAWDKKLFAYCC